MDSENPQKEYTGVWIPAEVMECDALEPIDKLVYGEIACFRECYGSNEWLAKRVKRSVRTVINSVNKLVDLGFVERTGFNGRFRTMRCAVFSMADVQNSAQQTCQILHTENKVKNKVNNIGGKPQNEAVENSDKKEYGNHEVNALLELWEHETGIIANVGKANRIAAYNLIRKKGFDGAKAVVELCGRAIRSGDRYAPRVSSFRDLQGQYEKLSKLEAWEARQDTAEQGISVNFYCGDESDIEDISDEERARVAERMKKARAEMPFLRRKGGVR